MKKHQFTSLDDIPDFDFDKIINQNEEYNDTKQPKYTPKIIEKVQKRKEFLERTRNKRNERILNEEEKKGIYSGKSIRFESKSYKDFKDLEKIPIQQQLQLPDMNEFYRNILIKQNTIIKDKLLPEFQINKIQEKKIKTKEEYERKKEIFKKQYQIAINEREKQEIKDINQLKELSKSKVSKKDIENAKQRYLIRKQIKEKEK
ncbi:hypothetical protein EDI_167700 [Entamoeba dispar SAW760]|uniref:Uncharacterized protein n=1 Tax=Entamoeba dispar (strain ATCC PRA-260 / SAW760) TaxID=370354 RepID=B0EP36_ENTDS|nr:uncharacterized protein EDI_167700 [Entamoeba dispar SAW760]EDR23711.1 hypothetical protein EDI_167700 [Entamoeba dispar SAW760]|eukprot:EDR23711.1 hypothetical protein EDI_167700 [Entamoeba dispar SAW760]